MATVTFRLGKNAKLYIGAIGSGDPTTEVKRITDATLNLTRADIDASTRESPDVKTYLAGPADWELSFNILATDGAGPYATVAAAFHAGTGINAKCVNATTGIGVQASWIITEFSEEQPLDDVIKASVKLKPTIYDDGFLPTPVTA